MWRLATRVVDTYSIQLGCLGGEQSLNTSELVTLRRLTVHRGVGVMLFSMPHDVHALAEAHLLPSSSLVLRTVCRLSTCSSCWNTCRYSFDYKDVWHFAHIVIELLEHVLHVVSKDCYACHRFD